MKAGGLIACQLFQQRVVILAHLGPALFALVGIHRVHL
jgi:hypothetical protein